MYTVSTVKAELPQVTVLVNGVIYAARVSGRLNQFATVSLIQPLDSIGKRPGKGCLVGSACHADFQFAWSTIANALNSGNALTI